MELNTQDWKEFNLLKLCKIDMGNKFDNDKMSHDNPCVNFVSRTGDNNGVSDFVDKVRGVKPYPANSISVALGGSIGSCFLQTKPFYTGQNVSVLLFDDMVSNEAKLFITTMFMNECKYKYVAFGRELNVHIRKDFVFFLPIQHNADGSILIDNNKTYSDDGYVPDWEFMENYIKSLHSEPITTKICGDSIPDLEIDKWEEFRIGTLFELSNGKNKSASDLEDGDDINYIGAKRNDNGVMNRVKLVPENVSKGNCVIFICNGQGSVGYSIYMDKAFIGTADIVTGYNENINASIGLFIATVASLERPRYSFGRKWKKTLSDTLIKLPIQRDDKGSPIIDSGKKYSDKGYIPDWVFMENYIKSLPYSDRI